MLRDRPRSPADALPGASAPRPDEPACVPARQRTRTDEHHEQARRSLADDDGDEIVFVPARRLTLLD